MKKASSFRRELFLRRLLIVAFVTVPVALLAGIIFFIYRSPLFRTSGIEVSGNLAVDVRDIEGKAREMAASNIFGKILGGDHVFAWSRFPESRLMDEIFRLKSVRVEVADPERKVRILVSEREESIIWCLVGGEDVPKKCFWVDGTGVIFADGPDAEGSLIMVVNDRSGRILNIKDRPLSDRDLDNFRKMSEIFDRFDWVVSDITLKDASLGELSVKLPGGQEVFFDLATDPSFGISVIRTLMESGEWPRVQYLDLRVEGKGFYRMN